MAQTPSYDTRKVSVGRLRPSASTVQSIDPALRSPHTPLSRSVSGLYGSPGSSFRIDDENLLIFEFGTRYLRAGFAGEPAPRCTIAHTPDLWRRVGDYRQWELGYEQRRRKRRRNMTWGEDYELWKLETREVDMGVIEDRIERLVRDCENRFLMLDNRTKRAALVVPSSFPRPLLSVVLKRLFDGLQAPAITLLPSSVMAAVAAGVRSALVVDIGWHETTVTAVYEYREASQRRSIRAGKMLSEEFGKLLNKEYQKALSKVNSHDHDENDEVSFEEVEEVMARVGWCQDVDNADQTHKTVSIPLSGSESAITLDLPFSQLSSPAETALFARNTPPQDLDDHNLPLHHLVYTTLLHLPIDIRQICMSRILTTGGPSNLPGLKRRILNSVTALVEQRGWDPVRNYGSATPQRKKTSTPTPPPAPNKEPEKPSTDESIPAAHAPQEPDPIATKLAAQSLKENPTSPSLSSGSIRGIHTLGPWAGASLVVNQRIKGVVEIDREKFLSAGLVGGVKKDGATGGVGGGVEVGRGRQSLGPGVKEKMEGKGAGGWTLGVWA